VTPVESFAAVFMNNHFLPPLTSSPRRQVIDLICQEALIECSVSLDPYSIAFFLPANTVYTDLAILLSVCTFLRLPTRESS
jgi:hypothetical protein